MDKLSRLLREKQNKENSIMVSNKGENYPQIYVSGREYKVPGPTVSYDEIVKIWNELHKDENKEILGTPGIDYEDGANGKEGILLPGKSVEVIDGTRFSVDPEHVS